MSNDATLDILGLRGALPCPGWMVLDHARDHRFTGELIADAETVFSVYFDRGRIYVAERAGDPPLGARLVEAGALNETQLEYGTLRIGHVHHLGRLFDRVPSVNRDGVLVLNELMTEECVRALARQQVSRVTVTPYRHHDSGMHRWEVVEPAGAPVAASDVPEMALPAPPPDSRPLPEPTSPIDTEPPLDSPAVLDATVLDATVLDATVLDSPAIGSAAAEAADARSDDRDIADDDGPDGPLDDAAPVLPRELFVDDVVEWNEPSLLVTDAPPTGRRHRRAPRDLFAETGQSGSWIDDLATATVGVAPLDGGGTRRQFAPATHKPADQFELVWPSGETVDLADPATVADHADHDRVGPTARIAPPDAAGTAAGQLQRHVDDRVSPARRSSDVAAESDLALAAPATDDSAEPPLDPQLTLAVRRAVMTIDTGSLEARRRLASAPTETLTPPGRLVVRREQWRSPADAPATSVFDEQPVAFDADTTAESPTGTSSDHQGRAGAFRRLIDGLRRA